MNQNRAGTTWLVVKTSAFALFVTGSVVVLLPRLLLADPSLGAIDFGGVSLLGLLPILLGAALYLRCAYAFVLEGRGTPAPIDPPVQLVIRGPYRYTRNPMYVAVLAILVGEAVLFRDLAFLLFPLALAVGFQIFIVGYEEPVLRKQFGEAYLRYRAAVPRWIPSRSGLRTLHERSFLAVGALVIAAGALAHLLRLTVGLPVTETPDAVHAFLVVLAGYAGIGCLLHARRIALPGALRKTLFALAAALLLATCAMHLYSIVARENAWLGIFPMGYSVVAAPAYGALALFLKTRTLLSG